MDCFLDKALVLDWEQRPYYLVWHYCLIHTDTSLISILPQYPYHPHTIYLPIPYYLSPTPNYFPIIPHTIALFIPIPRPHHLTKPCLSLYSNHAWRYIITTLVALARSRFLLAIFPRFPLLLLLFSSPLTSLISSLFLSPLICWHGQGGWFSKGNTSCTCGVGIVF